MPCHYSATFIGGHWNSELSPNYYPYLEVQAIYGVASVYLQELCTQVESIHGRCRLWSASTGCIQLPSVQTSVAQWSFAYNGPAVWNGLPATLLDSSVSLHTFKWRLKTYFCTVWWIPSGAIAGIFLWDWRCYIRLLTYLLNGSLMACMA